MNTRFNSFGSQQDPSNCVPESWPPALKRLHRLATVTLKGVRRASQQPLSGREGVERDDLLTMMGAMANPQKTAAVYFAMAEAMSAGDGRGLSDRDLAVAEDLCRALEHDALTAEELQAVERLARKRRAESVG